jgi:hypothetical protein
VHVGRGAACGGPLFASLGSRNVRHGCEDHRNARHHHPVPAAVDLDGLNPEPPQRDPDEIAEVRCMSQTIATVAAAVIAGPGTATTIYWLNQGRKPPADPPQEPKK